MNFILHGEVFVSDSDMLVWILQQIKQRGLAVHTYQDEDNHRMKDLLGYAKEYLALDAWAVEKKHPALLRLPELLGFPPGLRGLKMMARWNDESSLFDVQTRIMNSIKGKVN
jgi:hypothetical protein